MDCGAPVPHQNRSWRRFGDEDATDAVNAVLTAPSTSAPPGVQTPFAVQALAFLANQYPGQVSTDYIPAADGQSGYTSFFSPTGASAVSDDMTEAECQSFISSMHAHFNRPNTFTGDPINSSTAGSYLYSTLGPGEKVAYIVTPPVVAASALYFLGAKGLWWLAFLPATWALTGLVTGLAIASKAAAGDPTAKRYMASMASGTEAVT